MINGLSTVDFARISRGLLTSIFVGYAFFSNSPATAQSQELDLSGFRVFEHTLADVKRKLGETEMVERVTTETYTAYLCYLMLNDQLMLRFMSGEQGQGKHALQGFELGQIKAPPPKECTPLSSYRAFHVKPRIGAFYIGMSQKSYRETMTKLAAEPTDSRNVFTRFTRNTTRSGIKLKTIFDADFEQNKLIRIKIWTTRDTK